MSNGTLNYAIGGDASGLGQAFEHGLRFAGDAVNKIKAAFSVRGIFDGLANGLQSALGGSNLGEIFSKSLKTALGKEQIQQNFEGMLGGDAAMAEKTIAALTRFAHEAGMAKEEVLDSARKLLADRANAPRAVEDLKMLGEVSRGLGVPLGELSGIWGRMFAEGSASSRELMEFQRMNVDMAGALAATMGVTRERVKEMGEQGKITFGMVEKAMESLTGAGGKFAGQIERHRNTLGALAEEAKATFGKIPTAFFEGIIGAGMGGAKQHMREIRDMLSGWVASAREFGATLAAAFRVGKQLWDSGQFGTVLSDALIAGVGGAITLLVRGLAAAATGFISALLGAMQSIGDAIKAQLPEFLGGGGKAPNAGEVVSKFFGDFMGGAKGGWEGTAGIDIGKDARDRFSKTVTPLMFEARGGAPAVMESALSTMRAALTMGLGGAGGDGLGAKNQPDMQRMKIATPALDAMSKIGLTIGHGGAQGEAHARDTAKNTEKSASLLDQMEKHMNKIASWKEAHAAF